jgi:hypothetical protein
MSAQEIKQTLMQIAENVKANTTIEDVYAQLALLSDIEKSEKQVKQGKTYTQTEVRKQSKKWLK